MKFKKAVEMNDDGTIKALYGLPVIQTDSLNYKPIYDSKLILGDMSQYIGYEKYFEIFIDGHKIEISNIFELEESKYYGFYVGDKPHYAKRDDYNKISFYRENK